MYYCPGEFSVNISSTQKGIVCTKHLRELKTFFIRSHFRATAGLLSLVVVWIRTLSEPTTILSPRTSAKMARRFSENFEAVPLFSMQIGMHFKLKEASMTFHATPKMGAPIAAL